MVLTDLYALKESAGLSRVEKKYIPPNARSAHRGGMPPSATHPRYTAPTFFLELNNEYHIYHTKEGIEC